MENNKTTFKSEFIESDKFISIPMLQRDYVQGGRNDVISPFLDKLTYAWKENKTEDLNYIYGYSRDGKFIPIDGQQRLITLWLLHLYVYAKKSMDFPIELKFESREFADNFCKKLRMELKNILEKGDVICKGNDSKDDSNQKQKTTRFPQNIITDSSWFISGWLYDTTVKNILNTLNLIHDRFKDATEIELAAQSIMFDFLDMKEKNLTDDVYVKMNGRGRPLSYFENLKSWMDEQIKTFMGADDQFTKDWQTKMDNEWTDLFWNNRNKNQEHPEEIDDEQLRFFYSILLLYWKRDEKSFLNSIEIENDNDKIKQNFITFLNESEKELFENASIKEIRENTFSILLNAKRMIPLYWIEKTELFNVNTFLFIKNSIEKLCIIEEALNDNKTKNILSMFDFKQDQTTCLYKIAFNDASYAKTLPLLYALIKTPETYQTKENIYQWIRIWKNLILNTNIDKDNIRNICCTIDTIAEQVDGKNLYKVVSNLKWEVGFGFNEEQFNEEIAKAKQIRTDWEIWEKIIIESESHAFFKGAIRFLFIDGKGDINWCDFDTKWDNARKWFTNNRDEKDALLLKNFILTFNDNWSLLTKFVYNNKDDSWRNILLNAELRKHTNQFLLGELKKDFENFESLYEDAKTKLLQEELIKTDVLKEMSWDKFSLRWGYNHYFFMPCGAHAEWRKYVLATPRNKILTDLFKNGRISFEKKRDGTDQYRLNDSGFYWGWNIKFLYSNKWVCWNVDNQGKEYLYLNEQNDKKIEIENYFNEKTDDIIKKLSQLISIP